MNSNQSRMDALADAGPWPLCNLHGQAEGACLPCHEYQIVRDAMPHWAWRLHANLLLSISLGYSHIAAEQARGVAHAAFYHAPWLKG